MSTTLTLDVWQEYVDVYCQLVKRMVGEGHLPPSPQFIAGITGLKVSKKKTVSPPKVTQLAWLLPHLPPLIARRDIDKWLPGVTGRTLANADSCGKGPRVRYTHHKKIVYPTGYLLEWIEKCGVEVHVNDMPSSVCQ